MSCAHTTYFALLTLTVASDLIPGKHETQLHVKIVDYNRSRSALRPSIYLSQALIWYKSMHLMYCGVRCANENVMRILFQAVILIMIITLEGWKTNLEVLNLLQNYREKQACVCVMGGSQAIVAYFFCCSSYNKTLSLSFSSSRDVPAKNIASQVGACTFLTASFFKFLIVIWTTTG